MPQKARDRGIRVPQAKAAATGVGMLAAVAAAKEEQEKKKQDYVNDMRNSPLKIRLRKKLKSWTMKTDDEAVAQALEASKYATNRSTFDRQIKADSKMNTIYAAIKVIKSIPILIQ